jgi:hypothetical protein
MGQGVSAILAHFLNKNSPLRVKAQDFYLQRLNFHKLFNLFSYSFHISSL